MPDTVMPRIDEAIRYLLEFARHPRSEGYGMCGYDLHIPVVINAFRRYVRGEQFQGFLGDGREAESLSPIFLDAAWELCRRGILRPSVKDSNGQGQSGGLGFSVTETGRIWIAKADDSHFIPTDRGALSRLVERFRDRLGDGYFQRAQEAILCHFATAYLASCAMSGAAAESILLHIAIAKSRDESRVLKTYKAANGRRKIEDLIVGQLEQSLASKFRNLMDLLKYWRDEASHGEVSEISEFEAYEAIARLLRLAHFAKDHWDALTRPQSNNALSENG